MSTTVSTGAASEQILIARLDDSQAKEVLGDDWQGWCRMTMMAVETTVPFPSSRYRSRPEIRQS
ncbi:hypothetical protein RWA06_30795 (plasmid) [Sinorhizobium meliloti]|uniref:hypothetical protein n=1 Tax=Rhizobium meliloti TaxID=382 RepID=UPI00299E698E